MNEAQTQTYNEQRNVGTTFPNIGNHAWQSQTAFHSSLRERGNCGTQLLTRRSVVPQRGNHVRLANRARQLINRYTKLMTDTDDDSVDSARIDSDSNIYAAVEESDSGVEINADATPVDLPAIHEKAPPPSNALWSNNDITWLVGADVGSPRSNYYTYAADIEDATIFGGRRMQLLTDGVSVQFGHTLANPWVDAVVRLTPGDIGRDGLDLELPEVRQNVQVPVQNIIDEQDVVEISTANTSRDGEWLHGISSPERNRWEIFAPIDEVDVETDGYSLHVPFTENAIVQSSHSERNAVTRRQSGLFVRGVHTIDAEDVPDVAENENGPTMIQNTELFAENEMIE